jgi:hypothetical protein
LEFDSAFLLCGTRRFFSNAPSMLVAMKSRTSHQCQCAGRQKKESGFDYYN